MSLADTTSDTLQQALPVPGLLIGDRTITTSPLGVRDRINPATGDVLASFPIASPEQVDDAVRTAWAAFPAWKAFPADQRRRLLFRLAETVREHQDELQLIQALETGTPISRISYDYGIDHLEYYAGWTDKHEGELVAAYPRRALDYVKYEPYGVVAALTTWNGPINSALLKLAPALAAGNCVVVKTAVLGPFAIQRVIELFLEAGLPPGVVNLVHGDRHTTQEVVRHPGIRKVSFTGGPSTAQALLKIAANDMTPMTIELGGKSANIIFPDADLEAAAHMAATMSTITGAGQGCLFPTRLLVHDSVYAEVLERVEAIASQVEPTDPLDPEAVMGPVIEEAAADRILGMVARAQTEGADLIAGGRRVDGARSGCFVLPTVLGGVKPTSEIAQTEVFGPVLAVTPFKSETEAVEMANSTEYGLAAYLHTSDLVKAHRVADDLEAGWIGVNSFPVMRASAPFGGIKTSGYGREGGKDGIADFVYAKNVYVPLDGV